MSINQKIILEIDDAKVLASLKAINESLNKIKAHANIKVNVPSDSTSGVNKLGDSFTKANESIKNTNSALKQNKGQVDSTNISWGRFSSGVFRFAYGAMLIARQSIRSLTEGLKELQEGLKQQIQIDIAGPYESLARSMSDASDYSLKLNETLRFAREGKMIGLSDQQLKSLASLSNLTSLRTGESSSKMMNDILKSIINGTVSEELAKAIPWLKDIQMRMADMGAKMMSTAERIKLVNNLMKQASKEEKELAWARGDAFYKLNKLIEKIKDSLIGIGPILAGVAGILGGLLAPILGLGTIGFGLGLAGGPITGLIGGGIGAAIGAAISLTLGGWGLKVFDNVKNGMDKITTYFAELIFGFKVFLARLFQPEGALKVNIPSGLQDYNIKQLSEISKSWGNAATSARGIFTSGQNIIPNLVEGFKEGYEPFSKINEEMRNNLVKDNVTGQKDYSIFKNIGSIFGAMLGILESILLVLLSILKVLDKKDTIYSKVIGGAIGGAVIGRLFGPVGMAAGAVIGGGTAATLSAYEQYKKMTPEEKMDDFKYGLKELSPFGNLLLKEPTFSMYPDIENGVTKSISRPSEEEQLELRRKDIEYRMNESLVQDVLRRMDKIEENTRKTAIQGQD